MVNKKLYQNVNVKPNHKKGNQNTNSINIIINPDEKRNGDDDEMYKRKQSRTDNVMNLYNNQPQVSDSNMGQILGRANRQDVDLKQDDVVEANADLNADNVIGAIQENINSEQLEEMLEAERIRNAENFSNISQTIEDEFLMNRQREADIQQELANQQFLMDEENKALKQIIVAGVDERLEDFLQDVYRNELFQSAYPSDLDASFSSIDEPPSQGNSTSPFTTPQQKSPPKASQVPRSKTPVSRISSETIPPYFRGPGTHMFHGTDDPSKKQRIPRKPRPK
jgi:hypothetical protein